MPHQILLPEEVADLLRVDIGIVEQLVAEGRLEAIHISDDVMRITQDAVLAFIRSGGTQLPGSSSSRPLGRPAPLGLHTNRAPVDRSTLPGAKEFRQALYDLLETAAMKGNKSITIRAGDLHSELGGYPGPHHRMPVLCRVMRDLMENGDVIVDQPASGLGARLTIRYCIPRP